MNEKLAQRKYMQLQMMKQQMQVYAEENHMIQEKMNELVITMDALQKISSVSKGDEMWTPVGSGGYVSASVNDTENVLIGIGAGVFIKEKREKALERVQKIIEEITALNNNVVSEMRKLIEQSQKIEMEIQGLSHEHDEEEHVPQKKSRKT